MAETTKRMTSASLIGRPESARQTVHDCMSRRLRARALFAIGPARPFQYANSKTEVEQSNAALPLTERQVQADVNDARLIRRPARDIIPRSVELEFIAMQPNCTSRGTKI